MKFLGTVLLALSALAKAAVVPTTVTSIQALDSTSTSLTLQFSVDVSYDASDSGSVIPFTFGDSANTVSFGSGTFTVPTVTAAGSSSVTAQATWAPAAGSALTAAVAVLSAFASNQVSTISVTETNTGVVHQVSVNGVGADIVQTLYVHVTTATVTTKASTAIFKVFNPFALPLGFIAVNATATDPGLSGSPTVGVVTQPDLAASSLAFTVPAGATQNSTTLPARTDLTITQITQVLRQYAGGANVPLNVVANSTISIGSYNTGITLTKTVGSFLV
ncbi:hypothetical protein DFJ73DRAFT_891088 [Zopfochytrium polystomum]|nr:hypothetical protein DFJ73DRAFT_891088 [Zopfochytrium polystomum]